MPDLWLGKCYYLFRLFRGFVWRGERLCVPPCAPILFRRQAQKRTFPSPHPLVHSFVYYFLCGAQICIQDIVGVRCCRREYRLAGRKTNGMWGRDRDRSDVLVSSVAGTRLIYWNMCLVSAREYKFSVGRRRTHCKRTYHNIYSTYIGYNIEDNAFTQMCMFGVCVLRIIQMANTINCSPGGGTRPPNVYIYTLKRIKNDEKLGAAADVCRISLYSVCLFFHGQQCRILCVNVCEKYFVCEVVVCRFRCSHSALVEIDDDGNE